jgi:hypothetical protein
MSDSDDSEPEIKLTKLDAARRQLRTAITLWFTGGDPVSTHTLASAAHEIIHRLFRKQGLKNLMFDSVDIKDEDRADFARFMKKDAAFFKHANSDTDAEMTFHPITTEILLVMSVVGIHRMGLEGDEEAAMALWHNVHNPAAFSAEDIGKHRAPLDRLRQLSRVNKSNFFEAIMQTRRELRKNGGA